MAAPVSPFVSFPATSFTYPVGERGGDPFATHIIVSRFLDPGYYESRGVWHPGEDWSRRGYRNADQDDPVYAVADGVVVAVDWAAIWGNIVVIRHLMPDGWCGFDNACVWSQYAHLGTMQVGLYQAVKKDELIGTVGAGDPAAKLDARLHFEIRRKNIESWSWGPIVRDKSEVEAHYFSPSAFIEGFPNDC